MSKLIVLVDTAEQQPWTFRDIPGEGHVSCKRKYLGTKKDGIYIPRADYSVEGYVGQIHIERKSCVDAQSTILGFTNKRRKRFEKELEFLQSIEFGCVIVESSFGTMLANPPQRGMKSIKDEIRTLHRTVLSWQSKYCVPWFFCDDRRFAEITAYRFLQRSVRKLNDENNDNNARCKKDSDS